MTIVRRGLALITGVVLLAGGAGGGIAMASASSAAPAGVPAVSVPASVNSDHEDNTGPDTDNIQQGDQNAPDHKTNGEGQEQESSREAPDNGVCDGPGGHADANSSVDHQFTGEE